LGDGVSEEHDSGFSLGGRAKFGVSFAVLRQVRPVAQFGGELLVPLLEGLARVGLVGGEGFVWRGLLRRGGGEQKQRGEEKEDGFHRSWKLC
jgi:hypothetical protein